MKTRNSRPFEFKLGKRGFILLIFGISLLLFSAYLFGVKVGENIDAYPEKLSRGILDMLKGDANSPPERTNVASAVGEKKKDGNFDLTFYDTLHGKEEERKGIVIEGNEEKKIVEKTDQPVPGSEIQLKKAPPPRAPSPAAKEEKSVSPQEREQKDKKPSTLPAAGHAVEKKSHTAKGKYLIQAASYKEKEKADNLCRKLKALGYTTVVVTADLPGKGRWFRVVLKGFETSEDARKAVGTVSEKIGGMKSAVQPVKEPVESRSQGR